MTCRPATLLFLALAAPAGACFPRDARPPGDSPGPVETGDTDVAVDSDSPTDTDERDSDAAPDADGDGAPDVEDCDDGDPDVHPGAAELCDGVDQDCDDMPDDGLAAVTFYADVDGDAFGDAAVTTEACAAPDGYVADDADCDDTEAAVHPGATETCNGVDDDCDGAIDEAGATGASTYYRDTDGDGYGTATTTTSACAPPSGYVANDDDCDDAKNTANPAATESCNGTDDDCDGQSDEAGAVGATTWFADGDGDGFGNPSKATDACTAPVGHVANATDCYDANAAAKPGQTAWFGSSRGDGSFDYDCDGAATPEIAAVYTCASDACGGSKSTPGWSGTVPACGATAIYDAGNGCTGECQHSLSSRTLQCR